MFKEIIELGERLESERKLVPSGFYPYKEPIKWVVHIFSSVPLKCHIEKGESGKTQPRPKSGRTKRTDLAHPIADEAGYVFGIDRKKDGEKDDDAEKKHKAYMSLLDKMDQNTEISTNKELKEAISSIREVVSKGVLESDKRFNEIMNKDWISFVVEYGALSGKHLFEHPDIKAFWVKELQANSLKSKKRDYIIEGECSICGRPRQLLKRMPGVKLYKPIPLHSYNEDAFVSYIDGADVSKRAHIGQCFICGDTIARTLNYLRDNELHCKQLMVDKRDGKPNTDSARNQFAFFWLKDDQPIRAEETSIDPAELLRNLVLVINRPNSTDMNTPPPDLMQLENMLNVPWSGRDASVNIANNAFYLLVLSPNKGRIAVRDWLNISLDKLQENLKAFLDSQRIIDPNGKEKRCFGIPEILEGIENSNISKPSYKAVEISNPNISRQLLRTAYLGEPPPSALLEAAVMCMRNMKIFDERDKKQEMKNKKTQHVVMATLKMLLTHRKEGMKEMETLETNRNAIGYLCGILLSILEEAQLRAARWKINTTLVERFYGSASSAPASVFGTLVRRATTDHLPKIRKQQLGYTEIEELMESVEKKIDLSGGYPKILSLEGQAEFSLGFYHQRAKFREKRAIKKSK